MGSEILLPNLNSVKAQDFSQGSSAQAGEGMLSNSNPQGVRNLTSAQSRHCAVGQ